MTLAIKIYYVDYIFPLDGFSVLTLCISPPIPAACRTRGLALMTVKAYPIWTKVLGQPGFQGFG